MNNGVLVLIFWSCPLFMVFAQPVAHRFDMDAVLRVEISQALARQDETVTLSFEHSYVAETQDFEQHRSRALDEAFRHVIDLVCEQILGKGRYEEMKPEISQTILSKPRLYIYQYQTGNVPSEGGGHRLALKVTVNLSALNEALVRAHILQMNFEMKMIRVVGLNAFSMYDAFKHAFAKGLRSHKRLVEVYQKRGEVRWLVETTASYEELEEKIQTLKNISGLPPFTVTAYEQGGLLITISK
ncbi:MAG: hypothetical protein HY390_05430 [Deltaproteobacteria bacterium]|nr:hypothetical protein [Deltaproteobacteria bacterium]